MASNHFGEILKLSSFGSSHGAGVGALLDGMPAGITLDLQFIQSELNRRKPGQNNLTTPRKEEDELEVYSGMFEGKTTGDPIGLFIGNKNQKSKDYSPLKDVFRPSHADYTYQQKYGLRDHRGGGRSSARITAPWVAAGAIAQQLLDVYHIEVISYVTKIYRVKTTFELNKICLQDVENSALRCPDDKTSILMQAAIEQAKKDGDSLGGIIRTEVRNVPLGLGDPVFEKLHALLAKAIMSINACKGVQFGLGFDITDFKGSEINDEFQVIDNKIKTKTNNSGGLLGGISNGETLYFDSAFKPTASISKEQSTVNNAKENINLSIKGRHDPCVLPRAVPIVDAMTRLVLADRLLIHQIYNSIKTNME